MSKSIAEKLENAVYDTIVELGIGGYVTYRKFNLVFKVIDARTFANIMYATDQMTVDFEGKEVTNEANIPLTISKYNFEEKKHFHQVEAIFRRHFGSRALRF